jgi:hypothetical protein
MRGPSAAAILALLAAGLPSASPAQAPAPEAATPPAASPSAADVLFDSGHWRSAPAGTDVSYQYVRRSGLESVFGPALDDRIRLHLDPGDSAATRTVRVELFSGPRRRAAGPFEDVPGNPAVVLFLEHHLENLARVLKANPRYLKNAIRAGLRDRADVTPTTVTVAGRQVAARVIEARPFVEDPNKARMRGLETIAYRFTTSDEVPGTILSIEAKAIAPDGGTLIEERLTYDPGP